MFATCCSSSPAYPPSKLHIALSFLHRSPNPLISFTLVVRQVFLSSHALQVQASMRLDALFHCERLEFFSH
jgi:hypothetical protein